MTGWTDLINALAARRPEVRIIPPTLKYEDLWDQQQRIEALEAEVKYLRLVLKQVVERLHEAEEFPLPVIAEALGLVERLKKLIND